MQLFQRTGASAYLTGAVLALALLACKKEDETPAVSVSAVPANASAPAATAAAEASFEDQVKSSTPLSPKPKSLKLGATDFAPELCTTDEPLLHKSNMDVIRAVQAVGSKLYLVFGDGKLRRYDIGAGACNLKQDKAFGTAGVLSLEREIKTLSQDSAGNLVAANGIFESFYLSGGQHKYTCNARGQGYVSLHPSGKWGLGPFANATVNKVTYGATACESEPWVLQDLSQDAKRKGPFTNVNTIGFVGDLVLVGGILAKTVDPKEPRVVIAMDASGKEKFRFGGTEKSFDERSFGWVHAIGPCKSGICVVDSNMRRLSAWSKTDGSFVGSVKLSDAFDLKYPWISSFSSAKDGALYFAAGQSREGSKVAEGLIYRAKGI